MHIKIIITKYFKKTITNDIIFKINTITDIKHILKIKLRKYFSIN
jgi:hypothetical protein